MVKIGVALDYVNVSEFEDNCGNILYGWRKNETYKTPVSGLYFYIGFGVQI